MKSVEEQIEGLFIQFKAELDTESDEIGLRTAKECAAELKRTSPRDRQKYYLGWTVKAIRGFGKSVAYTVYNRTYPGLTHLLERGHGNAKARPHIKAAEAKYSSKYLEELERAVQNAGE